MKNIPLSQHFAFGSRIRDVRDHLQTALVEASRMFGTSALATQALERSLKSLNTARSALDDLACSAKADVPASPTKSYY